MAGVLIHVCYSNLLTTISMTAAYSVLSCISSSQYDCVPQLAVSAMPYAVQLPTFRPTILLQNQCYILEHKVPYIMDVSDFVCVCCLQVKDMTGTRMMVMINPRVTAGQICCLLVSLSSSVLQYSSFLGLVSVGCTIAHRDCNLHGKGPVPGLAADRGLQSGKNDFSLTASSCQADAVCRDLPVCHQQPVYLMCRSWPLLVHSMTDLAAAGAVTSGCHTPDTARASGAKDTELNQGKLVEVICLHLLHRPFNA